MDHSSHTPVLLQETMDYLAVRPGGIYLDATCGAGGHSEQICLRLKSSGRLIAIDQDEQAIEIASKRLAPFKDLVTFYSGNFSGINRILDELKIESIDGAIADLGVSSMQLDDPGRGFSFDSDDEVDMRMDRQSGISAAQLIRATSQKDLATILSQYGEQPMAGRVARAIFEAASEGEKLTGRNLRQIVHGALPYKFLRQRRVDPATKVFMALRIAVNDELAAIESFLENAHERLAPDGRLVVISFHSLEDRIVKRFFRDRAGGCTCPRDLPVCGCGNVPTMKVLTRKPVAPGDEETSENPRARSARLRAAEKLA